MTNDCFETANRLGVGRSTVFKLWKSGELKSVTIGKRRFSTDRQIAEYVHQLEVASDQRIAPALSGVTSD